MELSPSISSPPKYPLFYITKWPLFVLRFTGYLPHQTKNGLLQDPWTLHNPYLWWSLLVAFTFIARDAIYHLNLRDVLQLVGQTLATDLFTQTLYAFVFTVLQLGFVLFPVANHKKVAHFWKENSKFLEFVLEKNFMEFKSFAHITRTNVQNISFAVLLSFLTTVSAFSNRSSFVRLMTKGFSGWKLFSFRFTVISWNFSNYLHACFSIFLVSFLSRH